LRCARDSCGENAINFNNYTYHDGNVFISDTKCLIYLVWKVSNWEVIKSIYDTRFPGLDIKKHFSITEPKGYNGIYFLITEFGDYVKILRERKVYIHI